MTTARETTVAMIPARVRLVLLDRDGVLNRDRPDSVKTLDELVVLDGAAEAVAALNQAGIRTAIVTNQSIIGRGAVRPEMLGLIYQTLLGVLRDRAGAKIDALFVAPDAPDRATERRKPGAGMLLEAMAQFAIPCEQTVMIGDAATDLAAARSAGIRFHLVRTGKGSLTEQSLDAADDVEIHDNVRAAVAAILAAR